MIVYLAWLTMLTVFGYTIFLAGSYWMNHNKSGAIFAIILAIAVLILPIYSILMI